MKTAEEKAENIFFQRTFDPNLHNLVSMCLEKNPAHRLVLATKYDGNHYPSVKQLFWQTIKLIFIKRGMGREKEREFFYVYMWVCEGERKCVHMCVGILCVCVCER